MSHFTVLVIGDDYEKLLAPYHEYECTGRDDEYVIDVDITDEVLEEWEKEDERIWVEDATGEKFSPSDKRFYHIATEDELEKHGLNGSMGCGRGVSYFRDWADDDPDHLKRQVVYIKINDGIPPGYTEQYFSMEDSGRYVNIAEFADSYYNAFERDGQFYRHTNPNAKWDGYQVGGRWAGFFKIKDGATASGLRGENGLMGSKRSNSGVDQLHLGDIDFEGMKKEARKDAAETWDKAAAIVAGLPQPTAWKDVREQYKGDIDKARDVYGDQPAVMALRRSNDISFGFEIMDLYGENARQKYIDANECSYVTFAVCTEDGWFEKGRMGWWACVTDEKLEYDWAAKYMELLDGLPPETIVTAVDCHI